MAKALIKAMNQIQYVCGCADMKGVEMGQKQEQWGKWKGRGGENRQEAWWGFTASSFRMWVPHSWCRFGLIERRQHSDSHATWFTYCIQSMCECKCEKSLVGILKPWLHKKNRLIESIYCSSSWWERRQSSLLSDTWNFLLLSGTWVPQA